jgi:hypothetical protein
MGNAQFIGQVGALAVALGIGVGLTSTTPQHRRIWRGRRFGTTTAIRFVHAGVHWQWPRNPEGTGTIMKTFITALLIGTAALFGAAGVAHADSDVPHACHPLLHQPQTAFDGPNQAVQELERVYGLDANSC